MTKRSTRFGSQTRAADGLIATFELPDGSVRVEHFAQIVRTGHGYARVVSKEGLPSIEQVAARADALGARVLSLSSPETILTDLQGARIAREDPKRQRARDEVSFPEARMLGRIGRAELFEAPARRQTAETRRQSTHRRAWR